jgi:hypothetical protein
MTNGHLIWAKNIIFVNIVNGHQPLLPHHVDNLSPSLAVSLVNAADNYAWVSQQAPEVRTKTIISQGSGCQTGKRQSDAIFKIHIG